MLILLREIEFSLVLYLARALHQLDCRLDRWKVTETYVFEKISTSSRHRN
jgi:hypothetical protein